jgi:8-amino-3,8-dideoxy-alpha-D-manno-octulosonate transaminase
LLPTEAIARQVVQELKAQNSLPGNFYWFDNNWHYIRKWDHLKTAAALNPLAEVQKKALITLAKQDFSVSDGIMSRCISTAISLLWTEEQIRERGRVVTEAVKKALNSQKVTQ